MRMFGEQKTVGHHAECTTGDGTDHDTEIFLLKNNIVNLNLMSVHSCLMSANMKSHESIQAVNFHTYSDVRKHLCGYQM